MEGKIVFITGGASGIGKACADYLLECGAKKVYVADIEVIKGEKTEEELNAKYGENRAKFVKCDISNREEFEAAIKQVYEENENLDILLNNAGIGESSKVIEVNFLGTLNGIELGLKYMSEKNKNKGGTIINTISGLGFMGFDYLPKYTASKHAVVGLTKVYSRPCYVDKTNVRVMGVCPCYTDTDIGKTNDLLSDEIMKLLGDAVPQSPKVVAECVAEMLRNGESGSFWIAEDGEFYEIEIPHHKTLRKNKNK